MLIKFGEKFLQDHITKLPITKLPITIKQSLQDVLQHAMSISTPRVSIVLVLNER